MGERLTHVLAVLADDRWLSLPELVAKFAPGHWPLEVRDDAAGQEQLVRRVLALTAADGDPLFGEARRHDDQPVYKLGARFTRADYARVTAFHTSEARRYRRLADTLAAGQEPV